MTTHERMTRMYAHQEADRVPITDGPWGSTLERWHSEGLPQDVHWAQYFDLDQFAGIGADNSPQFPSETIEKTDEYSVHTTSWGATLRSWSHAGGVPEFLDFKVKDRDTWADAKSRMTPSRDRVNWDSLKDNYKTWLEEGKWLSAGLWFGFDVTHSWFLGTERVLMAMVEDPEWIADIFNHCLDVSLTLYDMVWDAGYEFDEVSWPDDMGYKYNQFFSLDMYRELVKPAHRRAAEWAHAKDAKVRLHSCGDVNPLVPDLIDVGIDMLNPLEVKAGMDPVALKAKYGDQLAFHGGLNAVLFEDMDAMRDEMTAVIPKMKENGGYLISSDHSVPDSVSFQEFSEFIALAKELGSYN
ncbi:MAG: uroporphyrinogen decarboxylase family protein [Candidatus Latescibacteria bacterium]|jgi:uroporphyrinogen decarboxylase|nr:uroporphyrinogen decarboxylase family protein [Candidatus Latescibacterota bacterium]